MEFKKIYRGEVVRTTPIEPYYFNRREFSVFITYSAGSIDGVENAFKQQQILIQPKTIGNNALIARVNTPVTGAVIVLNVTDEDVNNHELACERLRAAFFRLTKDYAIDLGLSAELHEDAWLEMRYLEMYKDAADNLVYELTK